MKPIHRICMVTPHFPPRITGISTLVYQLVRNLGEKNFRVYMITFSDAEQTVSPHGNVLLNEISRKNLEKAWVSLPADEFSALIVEGDKSLASFYLACIPTAVKIVEELRVDIFHIHSGLDDFAAAYLGSKVKESSPNISVVLTIHGGGIEPRLEESEIRRNLLSELDRITVVSNVLRRDLLDIGVPPDKVKFIPNGVDVNRFHPNIDGSEIRLKYGIGRSDSLILYVGRLDPGKGVQYLIAAFLKLLKKKRRAKLLLVGDGFLSKFVAEVLTHQSKGESVFIESSIPYGLMPKVYGAADVLVLPSTRTEACPMVLLEAMASGKPVVATHVGGVPEIIEDGKTGILISPSNVTSLTYGLLQIVKSKNLAETLGRNARKKTEKDYSISLVVEEYQRLYTSSRHAK